MVTLLDRYRSVDGSLDQELETYKQSEQAVERAIEGLEAERAAQGSKTVQLILFIFGALGLLSVLNDLYQLTNVTKAGDFGAYLVLLSSGELAQDPLRLLLVVGFSVAAFVIGIAFIIYCFSRRS